MCSFFIGYPCCVFKIYLYIIIHYFISFLLLLFSVLLIFTYYYYCNKLIIIKINVIVLLHYSSLVVLLLYSGNLSLVENYRPISLLCCVSKVLEFIILNHISEFVVSNISVCQFGFVRHRSSVQQLLLSTILD